MAWADTLKIIQTVVGDETALSDSPLKESIFWSRAGAAQAAKTLQEKFGAIILEQPILRDDGMWVLLSTNPLMNVEVVS